MSKINVIRDELGIKGGGVYCFLPFDNLDNKKKAVFKIGMAIKFSNRIENYHTYFPKGVYMIDFLENPKVPKNTTKKQHYEEVEKFVTDYLTENGAEMIKSTSRITNANEKGGDTEFFYTNQKLIHEAFNEAFKKYNGVRHHYDLDRDIKTQTKILENKKFTYVGKIIFNR